MRNAQTAGSDSQIMVWAMPPDEFGAWGQWAGALGSFLAVVVALWVAISDTRRRDREQQEQRAAQARTITTTAVLERSDSSGKFVYYVQIDISNHGLLPVTNFSVLNVHRNSELLWSMSTATEEDGRRHLIRLPVLAPGDTIRRTVTATDQTSAANVTESSAIGTWKVQIAFTDAEGLGWLRTGNGKPRRLALGDVQH